MLVPFGIGTYRRADLPRVRLVNLFAEKAPTTEGQIALLPRPALTPFLTLGSGPIRGVYGQDGLFSGTIFAVSGSSLYYGAQPLGVIPGTDPVQMTAADVYVMIANGFGLYRTDSATLTKIAFPDDAGVSDIAHLGGYTIAVRAGTRRLYFTLDTATWDGLDYVSAEQSPAPIVGILVVQGQLWAFSTDHVEIFYLTGDADAPIAGLPGRVFDKGCRSRESIVLVDNTAFWVGSDNIVYRGAGSPQRVSDHGIEEMIPSSQRINAFAFDWIGHVFYVLQLDDGTFAYDAATQQWTQFETYGVGQWRIGSMSRSAYVQTAGDVEDGRLWRLSDQRFTDGNTPISAEFTVLENNPIFIDTVTVGCAVGMANGSDPAGVIEMRTSRDGGETWSDWRQQSLGEQGRYRTRPCFRRVGKVDQDNMILHFRITDPVPRRISEVRFNDALGGRSR